MSLKKTCSLIVFVILAVVELFPIGFSNISLFLFVFWIVFSYIAFPKVFKHSFSQKRYLCLFLFLVFYFLSTSFGKGIFQGFVFTLFMMRVVSPILLYDILQTCDKKTQRVFVTSLIIIFVVYAIWMYQFIDLYGAELGIKSSLFGSNRQEQIASAFGYFYALPILMVALILNVRSIPKQIKNKTIGFGWVQSIAYILVIIYLSLLVFKSLFMTATLLLIFSVCLGLFYGRKRWLIKGMSVMVVLSVVFITQYDNISRNVNQLGSKSTDQRVEEVLMLLTGRANEAQDTSARANLSKTSFNTFLKHPIVGVNLFVGEDRFDDKIVGNHAEWFDMMALYGLFAFFMFYFVYKSLRIQYKNNGVFLPAIIYIITGFTNPMFYFAVNLTMFVMVPLLIPDYYKNTKQIA